MTTQYFKVRNGLTVGEDVTTIDATTGNIITEGTVKLLGASSGSVEIVAPTVAGTQSYTLPTAVPAVNGYVLASTTGGIMSWVDNSATGTTYDFNATSTTGGANLNLVGSDATTDTVKLANGTGVTVSYTSATEVGIAIGQDVATTATPTFAGATLGNITVGIATDNTITTTTGDLVLASATNVIDATTAIINAATLTVDGRSSIDSFSITTTSTATVPLIGTGRNAMTGLVNIIQGANVHCVNFTAVRVNATTALLTTFAEMYNTSALATFTADVSAGDLRLLVTPTSATSTVFNAVRTSLD